MLPFLTPVSVRTESKQVRSHSFSTLTVSTSTCVTSLCADQPLKHLPGVCQRRHTARCSSPHTQQRGVAPQLQHIWKSQESNFNRDVEGCRCVQEPQDTSECDLSCSLTHCDKEEVIYRWRFKQNRRRLLADVPGNKTLHVE